MIPAVEVLKRDPIPRAAYTMTVKMVCMGQM